MVVERPDLSGCGGASRTTRPGRKVRGEEARPHVNIGFGLAAVVASIAVILADSRPVLPVLGVGLVAIGVRVAQRKVAIGDALGVLGAPVLAGLFGVAVGLGALGRAWNGPLTLLRHLDPLATAAVAAVATVVLNNLPAAALLSARAAPHPFSLLIELNIGPNLFVTGSMAWVLWMSAAQRAGERPPVRTTVLAGLFAAPLALLGALGGLYLGGSLR
jgi:arsenical pump membrane protein